jgi:hypothetical protein
MNALRPVVRNFSEEQSFLLRTSCYGGQDERQAFFKELFRYFLKFVLFVIARNIINSVIANAVKQSRQNKIATPVRRLAEQGSQ